MPCLAVAAHPVTSQLAPHAIVSLPFGTSVHPLKAGAFMPPATTLPLYIPSTLRVRAYLVPLRVGHLCMTSVQE